MGIAEMKRNEEEEMSVRRQLVTSWVDDEDYDPMKQANRAVQKAEDRVRAATKARKEQERLQKIQEEKQAKIDADLEKQRLEMSQQSYEEALVRTRARLKAKMLAEQKEMEKYMEEAREKAGREARKVEEAVARATRRTSSTKYKIDLSEKTAEDLHTMFDPLALKGVMHRPRWKEFVQKYKLSDGLKLKKSDIEPIFSKCTKKGMKGLEFRQFCKAVSLLGNKRFPVKGNLDPNEAINRVLQATVRKYDREDLKRKRSDMRQKKKEFDAEQRAIAKSKAKQEARESETRRRKAEEMKIEREKRIIQLKKELEESRREQAELAKKRKILKDKKEAQKLAQFEKDREEQLKKMAEHQVVVEKNRREAEKRTKERLKKHAMKEKKEAAKQAELQIEREAKNQALAREGRKKAAARVSERKKKKVILGEEDTNNLRTLYDHYTSGAKFKRADWVNCTTTLGLLDGTLVSKRDLDMFYENVKHTGESSISFPQFCSAMGTVAQRTHPGEDGDEQDNCATKCLERLMFDIMGNPDEEEIDFDPNLDDSYLDALEETEEEKAARIEEEKKAKRERRRARRKREKEAQARAEEEQRIENEKLAAKMRKVEEARLKAANRVKKRKKGKFTVNEKDSQNLLVFYEYFKIAPVGMSRSDWLNCVSTLGIQDDEIIQKKDCEKIFNNNSKAGILVFEQFTLCLSIVALQKFDEDNYSQTKALSKLVDELMGEE